MLNEIVLIIDDDPNYRATLEETLDYEGYLVKTASDGKEALKTLERLESRVSLIILDIEMPGMHGMEFLTKVGQIAGDVPIIVASSKKGMQEDFDIKMHAQVKDFAVMPYDLDQFINKVLTNIRMTGGGIDKRLILIGEDNKSSSDVLEETLEQENYLVKKVTDGDSLYETCKRVSKRVEMIIFSIDMIGGTHGFCLDYIENLSKVKPGLPIIMTYSRTDLAMQSFLKGLTHIKYAMHKPIDAKYLMTKIQNTFK